MENPLSKYGIKVVTDERVPENEAWLVPCWSPETQEEREAWERQVGRILFGPV